MDLFLGVRKYNRYPVNKIVIEDVGEVIEMSIGGMKIRKSFSDEFEAPELNVTIFDRPLKAEIVWQDKEYMGLKFEHSPDFDQLIKDNVKRVKEIDIAPDRIITDDEIAGITKRDLHGAFMNLIVELESPGTNLSRFRVYIDYISEILQSMDENDDEERDTGEVTEGGTGNPSDLKQLLIREANKSYDADSEIDDIDFAIARLGLDSVKEISSKFLREEISKLEFPLSGFNNYESYSILNTVFFKRLTPFFAFEDRQGEGNLLLSLETKGIDVMMSISGKDLSGYYTSPSRIYSEVSRIYEMKYFGRDLLSVNKSYFENNMGMFKDLYGGYILAHLILNPWYNLDKKIKISLTKKKLIFSFIAYMTLIATKFIIDRDKNSGVILINILKKTGMEQSKIMDFVIDCVTEVNDILKKLDLKGRIGNISLPSSTFKMDSYLGKGSHFKYFMKTMSDFSAIKSIKRMALRYEDSSYAHFILGKFMTADDYGLNSKLYCVLPCNNISDEPFYIEDFYYFDLLVLKDIDRLPGSHIKDFINLWDNFEGKIIVTFSTYSFLDFNNKSLHNLLRKHIVDFPSYFSGKGVYEKMIDHTIKHITPFIGDHEVENNKYINDVVSMDYIKVNELHSYF
jgi:hypothetical protein